MREAKLVSVILVVSLLLFGCGAKASTNVSANASVNGSAVPPSGTQPPPPQPPPQVPPSGTVNGSMNGSSGGTGGSGSGSGYSGMEFGALMALGVPLNCQITTTSNGTTTTSKIYMKGSTDMRIETATGNPDGCQTMAIVMKEGNKKMYMGCVGQQLMPQCDWLLFEISGNGSMSGSIDTTGGSSVDTDFNDVPPSQIDCEAWAYDASKFEVDGDICDLG